MTVFSNGRDTHSCSPQPHCNTVNHIEQFKSFCFSSKNIIIYNNKYNKKKLILSMWMCTFFTIPDSAESKIAVIM